ncbi:hypothetical protein [Streptomyces sp. ISL-100]|uniref:hypothetical protein n=1 Tax=Streptomyces sp. ISL-100 TaxID=2819173 RepID=UPI001BE983CF|nr:hypothetical protein [Streptomyces sp. ISL-100]MBT2398262.1 hypothetical protein [Streptomyces sp. ISL-100]
MSYTDQDVREGPGGRLVRHGGHHPDGAATFSRKGWSATINPSRTPARRLVSATLGVPDAGLLVLGGDQAGLLDDPLVELDRCADLADDGGDEAAVARPHQL